MSATNNFLPGLWAWLLGFLAFASVPAIIIAGLLLPWILPGVLLVGFLLWPYAVWHRYWKEAR